MPSLFEHRIHQNIFYTSNKRHSIHINKNSSKGLKNFLQSVVATIDEVLHGQQSSDIHEGHQYWLCLRIS